MMVFKFKFNIRTYYETLQKNETNNKKVITHFKEIATFMRLEVD